MHGYGLAVKFVLVDGHADAFDELVSKTLEGIRANEPGTLIYVSHRVQGQPALRMFYELYRDRASFEAHEQQPHTRHFLAERGQHLESVSVDFLDALDGTSISSASPA